MAHLFLNDGAHFMWTFQGLWDHRNPQIADETDGDVATCSHNY